MPFADKIFIYQRNILYINPFVPNAPFLYPLKTSENLTVFWCFQGIEKGRIGKEWVKTIWQEYFLSSSINRSFSWLFRAASIFFLSQFVVFFQYFFFCLFFVWTSFHFIWRWMLFYFFMTVFLIIVYKENQKNFIDVDMPRRKFLRQVWTQSKLAVATHLTECEFCVTSGQ